MSGHRLVEVVPVDIGWESLCACGFTDWSLNEAGATWRLAVHLDAMTLEAA